VSKTSSPVPVSVITVAYNAGGVIRDTIESILAQEYPNVEYVVIDGASTDRTWEIVQEYTSMIDVAVSEPDGGIYDAMNKGAELASGEWIIYMNAGDTFASSDVLSSLQELFVSDADVILGGVEKVLVDEYETRRFQQTPGEVGALWKRMPTAHQSVLVRREHVLEYPFDTSYRWCADQDQLLRLQAAGKTFQKVDTVISVFDCQSDQVREDGLYIRERWRLSEGHVPLARRCVQFGYEWAHCHLWGPVVSGLRSLLPASWMIRIRRLRGTAGETQRK
jgi:glycosyltransferase involved in cell wall biosynthesis